MMRRFLTLIPIILLLGAALLLFFVNLVGANNSGVLGEFYWSEVETNGTPWTSFGKTRWTLYNMCGVKDGKNFDCTSTTPAYAYSPADNFDSTKGLPESFSDNRDTYYYLTRFAYAFLLIGIVFSVVSLVPVILSCCLSGFVSGILSSVATGIALLFTVAGAAVITAAHVRGRNVFNDNGYSAHVSAKSFGILWAAVACLLISFIWMCVVSGKGAAHKYKKRHGDDYEESNSEPKVSSSEESNYNNQNMTYNDNDSFNNQNPYNQSTYNGEPEPEPKQSRRFFFNRS